MQVHKATEDLSTSLKEARQDHPVIEELERFRVA
jgi:hypothetical protein